MVNGGVILIGMVFAIWLAFGLTAIIDEVISWVFRRRR